MPRLRIEIRVATARIERPVIEAEVGEAPDLVRTDRHAGHCVGEPVAVAMRPLERCEWIEIPTALHRVGTAEIDGVAPGTGDHRVDADLHLPCGPHETERSLSAEDRVGPRIRRSEENKIGADIETGDEVAADGEVPRSTRIGAGVVVHEWHRPASFSGCRGKARHLARQPEARAALIRRSGMRR